MSLGKVAAQTDTSLTGTALLARLIPTGAVGRDDGTALRFETEQPYKRFGDGGLIDGYVRGRTKVINDFKGEWRTRSDSNARPSDS